MSYNDLPDFNHHGYQVNQILGLNRSGGRITYLGVQVSDGSPIVIKQFQFARSGANWSAYEAHHQEIEILQRLNHPAIPRYLDSFATPDGFCMVQEYKPASPLSQSGSLTAAQVKAVAVGVLETLIDLQKYSPPVIHRDLKPENILVDLQESIRVYLVDFGFARIGGGEVGVSSTVKGSFGFIPPEQLRNRQLTSASDLYSLGVTLICLLTGIPSAEIGSLMDSTTLKIDFRQRLSNLNPQFLDWLDTMLAPDPDKRFQNAAAAWEALQPIDPTQTSRFVHRTWIQLGSAMVATLILGTLVLPAILNKPESKVSIDQSPELSTPTPELSTPTPTVQPIVTPSPATTAIDSRLCLPPEVLIRPPTPELTPSDPLPQDPSELTPEQEQELFALMDEMSRRSTVSVPTYLVAAGKVTVDLTIETPKPEDSDLARLPGSVLVAKMNRLTGMNIMSPSFDAVFVNNTTLHAQIETNCQHLQEKRECVGCILQWVDLSDRDLKETDLTKAQLERANLSQSQLQAAILIETSLERANLAGTDLSQADLSRANIAFANLQGAQILNGKLRDTYLNGADLRGVDLRGTDLTGADLEGADLSGANLQGATLDRANIVNTKVEGTLWPNGFRFP